MEAHYNRIHRCLEQAERLRHEAFDALFAAEDDGCFELEGELPEAISLIIRAESKLNDIVARLDNEELDNEEAAR